METIRRTRLTYCRGTSNKEYTVTIESASSAELRSDSYTESHYRVACFYGRIGATQTRFNRTGWVSRGVAENTFSDAVEEKRSHGYEVDPVSAAAPRTFLSADEEYLVARGLILGVHFTGSSCHHLRRELETATMEDQLRDGNPTATTMCLVEEFNVKGHEVNHILSLIVRNQRPPITQQQVSEFERRLQAGAITPNEARRAMGLEPISDRAAPSPRAIPEPPKPLTAIEPPQVEVHRKKRAYRF